jgi:hypothetical protein
MRANFSASAAACTFSFFKRKGSNIFQIPVCHKTLNYPIKLLTNTKIAPINAEPIINGKAIFISRSTPDGEV